MGADQSEHLSSCSWEEISFVLHDIYQAIYFCEALIYLNLFDMPSLFVWPEHQCVKHQSLEG